MYFYLYDAFLREKKFDVTLAKIEGRIVDLGIQGKSEKLTILKSMREVLLNALKRGAETVVAVGNDETLSKVIRIVADREVILGYIPVGNDNLVGRMVGIPEGSRACDVLAGRIVERLDLGKANEAVFLSFLALPAAKDLLLECDESYHVEPIGEHAVTVYNFGQRGSDPHDGRLEVLIEPSATQKRGLLWRGGSSPATALTVRSMKIKSYGKSFAAYADGQTVVKTPFTVSVLRQKIRMIVGKKRMF